eukprot:TRINITY_DN10888_c0_g1_i1.p1 TRINITY_DN10888_c0_g1~~TRINITY_DN10888_c0_g1_i1.p1  ORF type:complete len:117 (+),score=21.43 TRINITY_DN10888_c0_g1_i1:149-499(+)
MGACAASTLNFTYVNSMVERVELLSCSEQFSCFNAKVIMDSTQSPGNQYLDIFECKAPGACQGVSLQMIGGASVNDLNCPRAEYCPDCTHEICEWDPALPIGVSLLCGAPKPCFRF